MGGPINKLRIAHSESSLGWGGQEHRVLAELLEFQKRGCEVWLIAPPNSQIFARAQAGGVPVTSLQTRRWMFFWTVLRNAVWLAIRRIDVLNTHSSQDGWLLGIAGRLAFVPLIIRSRHIDVSYPNPRLTRLAFATFCDHVLTTSNKITAHLRECFRLSGTRITTVPTGIDLTRFSPHGPKADFATKGEPLIGMVSVLRSWKGHETYLNAARLLVEKGFQAKFVIVGDGPGRDWFPELAKQAGLQDHILFAGHREDVPDVLRALNILVIPSTKHEGVPQIGLQALATKTPVIGSDVGGIPEIIIPGQTGRIFPQGDAAKLAVAIEEALADRESTQRYTENGRSLVEREHSLEVMVTKVTTVYDSFLGL